MSEATTGMSRLDEVMSKIDPKTAKKILTGSQIEIVRYPLVSKGLTYALGGGIAAGRVCTTFGNPSAGKSLLFQESIGRIWQPMGLSCAYVDSEGTYNPQFSAKLGVDNDNIKVIRQKSFGAVTDVAIPLIENGLDILVIDSISDLLPEVFVDDGHVVSFEKAKQMMAHAKSNTQMMNLMHYANERTAIVLLSQTTTDLSGMHPEQKPHGGKKIEFGSSQMIRLASSPSDTQQIKGQLQIGDRLLEKPIGRKVDAVVKKNKLGRSHQKVSYNMYYAGNRIGIDTVAETVSLAEEFGVVAKGGAWYYFKDEKWQGEAKFAEAMRNEPELVEKIDAELAIAMNGGVVE